MNGTLARDPHHTALESMYRGAPINAFYEPRLEVDDARATIEIDVVERMFHAARSVHGSVYFKLLDDAAYFAAASLEREHVLLTSSFTTYLTRPVSSGTMRAAGRVVHRNRSQFIAEAVVTDGDGREVARGSGVFVRSRIRLRDVEGYGP